MGKPPPTEETPKLGRTEMRATPKTPKTTPTPTPTPHKKRSSRSSRGSIPTPQNKAPETITTGTPVTETPITKTPVTETPTTKAPTTESPTTEGPTTEPTTPAAPTKLEGLAQDLQNCSWEQLQDRFAKAMDERSEVEAALQKETAELLEVFIVWSQTTGFHDENRAYKRFKTRVDFVQNREKSLEEKKQHCANVVKAFESALALLRDD